MAKNIEGQGASRKLQDLKIAIVCDWLTNVGGAEKVLLEVHRMFPGAPIYTSKYDKKGIDWFFDADIRTGWLQIFPSRLRRFLGPLRQRWFSHLDLSAYDLVISITGAEAKSVKVPNGTHVSYCHVPTQYYWQMYDDYVKNPGFGILNPLVRFFFKLLVKPLRKKDFRAAQNVDQFITISTYAQDLIKKYYHRDAVVVHPVVEVADFALILCGEKFMERFDSDDKDTKQKTVACHAEWCAEHSLPADFFVTTSRHVTWKRLDLAIAACKKTHKNLVVIGEGPEHKNLVKLAGGAKNIYFVPLLGKSELAQYLAHAKGYIFPSLEPFGIAPVEAMAAGCPVIAFGGGGATDYVQPGINGMFFDKQSISSLVAALSDFDRMKFTRQQVSNSVAGFYDIRFRKELKNTLSKAPKAKAVHAENS